MDRQITHIEYENEEGELFNFDDHSNSLQFFNDNDNKDSLLGINDQIESIQGESFISELYDRAHMIRVSYTDIYDRYDDDIFNHDDMNLVRDFMRLLEQDSSNPNYQQEGGKKRKRSRKRQKSRKTRKVRRRRKSRKVRRSRKTRRLYKAKRVNR